MDPIMPASKPRLGAAGIATRPSRVAPRSREAVMASRSWPPPPRLVGGRIVAGQPQEPGAVDEPPDTPETLFVGQLGDDVMAGQQPHAFPHGRISSPSSALSPVSR